MLQRKFVLQRKFALQFEDESRACQENKYTDTSTTISEFDQLLYIYILQNYLIHFWTGLCMQHKLRELLVMSTSPSIPDNSAPPGRALAQLDSHRPPNWLKTAELLQSCFI
jgi:hypothetical protein